MIVSVVGAGSYNLVFEYSLGGGSWATCIDLVDGTKLFQNYGVKTISHTPQLDWGLRDPSHQGKNHLLAKGQVHRCRFRIQSA
jgi:hypothetical protein